MPAEPAVLKSFTGKAGRVFAMSADHRTPKFQMQKAVILPECTCIHLSWQDYAIYLGVKSWHHAIEIMWSTEVAPGWWFTMQMNRFKLH